MRAAYYMAPEMLSRQCIAYDERVDVFAFGITLCEMIARRGVEPSTLPRHSDYGVDEAAFMQHCSVDCPRPFHRLAMRCVAVEPVKRYEMLFYICVSYEMQSLLWCSLRLVVLTNGSTR